MNVGQDSKIVLIVGGAGGIGKRTAELLWERDDHLIVADRDQKRLDQFKTQHDHADKKLSCLLFDLTVPASRQELISWIREKFGVLDVLVVTAAVHSTFPVEFMTDETIDRVLNVNLNSHMKLVRDCLPLIRDGGRIVGVSSIAAQIGIPMSSLYSASKAGLEMFYESLSVEVMHRRIKCIVIQIGNVNTGFNETGNDYQPVGDRSIDAGYSRVVRKIDSRYGMDPAIVAQTILSAMESRSPKFCYVVGANAKKAHWAKRLLGRDWGIRLTAKYFGFK